MHPSELPSDNGLAGSANTPVGPARVSTAKEVKPFVMSRGDALGAGLRVDRDMRPTVEVMRHGTVQPDGTTTFSTTTPGACLHPFTAVGSDPTNHDLLTCGNCGKVVDPDATEEQIAASIATDEAPGELPEPPTEVPADTLVVKQPDIGLTTPPPVPPTSLKGLSSPTTEE